MANSETGGKKAGIGSLVLRGDHACRSGAVTRFRCAQRAEGLMTSSVYDTLRTKAAGV